MKKVPNCSIHNSITMLGRDKVLLGRCWGLSPQLKSVEFSFLPNVIHELQSIVYVKPLKKCFTLWDPTAVCTCCNLVFSVAGMDFSPAAERHAARRPEAALESLDLGVGGSACMAEGRYDWHSAVLILTQRQKRIHWKRLCR